jgi:hypothetical protein
MIFLLYVTQQNISINNTLHHFNILKCKRKFTTEHEPNNVLNFLDVNLINTSRKIKFHIYWKLTSTDLIFPNNLVIPLTKRSKHKLSDK